MLSQNERCELYDVVLLHQCSAHNTPSSSGIYGMSRATSYCAKLHFGARPLQDREWGSLWIGNTFCGITLEPICICFSWQLCTSLLQLRRADVHNKLASSSHSHHESATPRSSCTGESQSERGVDGKVFATGPCFRWGCLRQCNSRHIFSLSNPECTDQI